MNDKLPKLTKNQAVGNRAASKLKEVMQKFCIFQEIDTSQDIGIDFIGTIIENECPTIYNFNAQCKGTDSDGINMNLAKTEISYSIKTKTINYWKQKKDNTFIFLVDVNKEIVYWAAPLRELENCDFSKQESVTIHIPIENYISSKSDSLSSDFKFEIIRYYASFGLNVISQLEQIQHSENNDIEKMLELIRVLEQNMTQVQNKYDEIISDLNKKIKQDLKSILNYCVRLDQIGAVVRSHCSGDILTTKFSTGRGRKSVTDAISELEGYEKNSNVPYEDLYRFSKEIFQIRCNVLGFLREMVYEDMPFSEHQDIEEECKQVFNSFGN